MLPGGLTKVQPEEEILKIQASIWSKITLKTFHKKEWYGNRLFVKSCDIEENILIQFFKEYF